MRSLLLLALLSCRDDDRPAPPPSAVVVAEAAVIVDDATADALTSLSADWTTLVFAGSTPQLDTLQAGDVLVSDVHPNLHGGLLRAVLAVDRDGDVTTVTAGPAGLTDVIEEGSMAAVLDLSQAGVGERFGPDALVVGFNEEVVFDGDDDLSTTYDQVRVDGSVSIDPDLVIDIDISGFSLQKATVELRTDLDAYLTVDSDRQAVIDETFVLRTIYYTPITIFIGPVPVVFIPKLELAIDLDGSITARLRDTLEVETYAAVGFGYDDGQFGPLVELDPTGSLDIASFEPGGTSELKVALNARYDVAAYGMAGVYVGLGPYARLHVDTLGNPWWSVYGGVEGRAGAYAHLDVNFLFFDTRVEIFDYETDPLGFEELVAEADGVAPPLEDVVEEVSWARTYGGDQSDHPVALLPLDDGGVMVTGGTLSASPTPEDALVMRLDRLGNVAWAQVFDDLGPATSIVGVPGGFWAVAGSVGGGADEVTLLRLDLNGRPTVSWRLSAYQGLAPHQLVAHPDGGVFVAGAHGAYDGTDAWVARFAPDGSLDWSQALGGAREERVLAMAPTPEGGVWLAVSTYSFGVTFTGIVVAELDAGGNVLWQRLLDGDGLEVPKQLVPMPSGDLVVVGDNGGDAIAIRLSGAGDTIWARAIDSGGYADNVAGAALADTDRVLVGGKVGLGDDADLWAFRVDVDGGVDWARSYGGPFADTLGGKGAYSGVGMPTVASSEGGFFLAGTADSFTPEWSDVWVLRIGETGYLDFDLDPDAVNLNVSATVDDLSVDNVAGGLVLAALPLEVAAVLVSRHSLVLEVAAQGDP